MRLSALSLALAGALCLTGCSNLISLNPFVTDAQAVLDPSLPGVWIDPDQRLYTVRKDGTGYDIRYTNDSGEVIKFKGHLLISGDMKLLDLVSTDENPFLLQVHTPVRIWTEKSTLRMAFLDSDWLRQQAAQQLATAPAADHRTLMVAPGDAVREFLLKAGSDARAYRPPDDGLRRLL
jgi:hypothetical protein